MDGAHPDRRHRQELSPFPFVLMLGQDDNERIMGAKLRDHGVDVQWNTELVALEQQPDHVDADAQAARRQRRARSERRGSRAATARAARCAR